MRIWTLGPDDPWRKMTALRSILALENPTDSRGCGRLWAMASRRSWTWLSDSTTTTTELSGGSRRGIFGWLPKHLSTFPLWSAYLAPLRTWSHKLVPFLLCQVNIFLFRGGFWVLPASQVNEHSILWMLGPILLVPGRKYLLFSLFQKKKCKNNSLFKNKSSICLKRQDWYGLLVYSAHWESPLHKIAAQ